MTITPAVDPLFSFFFSFWAISFQTPLAYSALIGYYHLEANFLGPGASRSLETHLLLILKLPLLLSCPGVLSFCLSRGVSLTACMHAMPCQFKLFSNGRYEESFFLYPPPNQQNSVSSFSSCFIFRPVPRFQCRSFPAARSIISALKNNHSDILSVWAPI